MIKSFTSTVLVSVISAATSFDLPTGEPKQLYMQAPNGELVNLLDTFGSPSNFFGTMQENPSDFSFPSSFEFSAIVGIVSHQERGHKIFNGAQFSIFDGENNRVKIHRLNKIFKEIDSEVQVYDFNRMRLLVSDPDK